ncbi:fluoride efflux transporter CrcB [Micromonospora auratinigra]|uniref:Fluoride-specific ion channel FluC n=1 Tax=Micromonospora auratinigra TaxID=261654 RepID=A0A1A8ZE58_9ACTN|nr:fluoride efflux transporter CrcB [Micromonospora auratinigra]SBT42286.1 camphor resistance protein CrcB [Micromonospora auratinigra]
MTVLLIVLGAAVGAPLRYLTDRAVQARHDSPFPWGTLTVNMAGSLLLGALVAVPASPALTALVGTGFCGALTTWSTLGYETVRLHREGARRYAVANAAVSVVAGLTAASLGYALAHAVTG